MTVPCLLCDSPTHVHPWATVKDVEYHTLDQDFQYYHCAECEVLFLHPMPVDQLSVIYPANYYSFTQPQQSVLNRIKNALDSRLFRSLLKQIPGEPLSVLDIGGGSGWLATLVRELDPRIAHTEVVDIDVQAAQTAQDNGHTFFCGRIEDYQATRSFDLVLMLNLIEHVENPRRILEQISGLLSPQGKVLIKTPNFDSWDARLLRHENWGGFHCPRHWVLFNRDSFIRTAAQAGLRVEQLHYTQGAPFWMVGVLSALITRGMLKDNRDMPLGNHPLAPILLGVFAAVDMLRGLFCKTSQMFVVLGRQDPSCRSVTK